MKTIFETCVPRKDVLSGELREEQFAAHLRDVIDANADPIYRDPQTFFERTYPTDGIKTLLQEALGRLSGAKPTNAPIIRLETSFGGGKTHSLIALYHAARAGKGYGGLLKGFDVVASLPDDPVELIAGVVGSDLDPTNGLDHGDCVTYTMWGEIAYQLGGLEGYRLVQKSDEAKTAPGTQVFEKLVKNRPALIMIDEFAAFLRTAQALVVGDSTLARQSTSFLLSLLSFAAKEERVVVVITLADVKDAFSSETEMVQHVLEEAGHVTARQERIITPAAETEIAPIVTHRLFERVDDTEKQITAQSYHDYFEEQVSRQVELPGYATRAQYKEEIATNYPFSPQLITTLNRKTSTIPDFQRTRGALRLLALVVRQLWTEQPKDAWLIHPHHIDLGVGDIVNELTARLKRPQFRQVAEADIVGPSQGSVAKSTTIDQPLIAAGRPPYARRFATTVFLHSIVQGSAAGVELEEALLAVLVPGDDASHVKRAAESLLDVAWFLDYDGRKYRFRTEPSLNKLVADEVELIGRKRPKDELDRRITNIWRKGVFIPLYFKSETAEIDDDAREPKLVVIHYDAATAMAGNDCPPDIAGKLFEHSGTQEGYRTYKNNLLFLVADKDQVERMIDVARRHYAIARIVNDSDRMSEFSDEQRKKLKGMLEEAELQYRIAITRAYRYLFYPSSDAQEKHFRLARETLPAQDQGNVDQDQSQVILRVLRQLDKALTGEDKPLNAEYVKAKAWPQGRDYATTDEIRREFAKRIGLKMLLDINQLKHTLRDGCSKTGTWVYQAPGETEAYGLPSPAPTIEVSEDAVLYITAEARTKGIPIKGAQKPECPVCHLPIDQCICGIDMPPKDGTPKSVSAAGAPSQAFQGLLDAAHDAAISRVRRLFIKVEGSGKEASNDSRLLGLAIPQVGKGSFRVEQVMNCEFSDDTFQVRFAGSWERYKQVKNLTDAFGKQADKVNVSTQLQADFDNGLDLDGDQFETMKDVFAQLGFGKLSLVAEPTEKESK
ncbi:MAG: ATP-binding protein [Dehalococcoidia bacterium]|nr:ATP-binding protein [Dehalococcoidia bacterium]